MELLNKLNAALDSLLEGLDAALSEDPDTVLTESQLDDEMFENLDSVIRDVNAMMEEWAPETRELFDEKIDRMLEESDPELFEEKNIVRLDRNTVFKQLIGLLCTVFARRRKDPVFATYKKASMIRRKCKNTMYKKYATRAVPLARKLLKRRKLRS